MNSSTKVGHSEESRILLATLKTAVAHALDKKRRLGQYAVIWKNGRAVRIGADVENAGLNRSEWT